MSRSRLHRSLRRQLTASVLCVAEICQGTLSEHRNVLLQVLVSFSCCLLSLASGLQSASTSSCNYRFNCLLVSSFCFLLRNRISPHHLGLAVAQVERRRCTANWDDNNTISMPHQTPRAKKIYTKASFSSYSFGAMNLVGDLLTKH